MAPTNSSAPLRRSSIAQKNGRSTIIRNGCTGRATAAALIPVVVTAAASASLHNTTAMTVTVSYANSTAASGNPVVVKVAYTYVPYLNLPGLANALTFTSQGQILY